MKKRLRFFYHYLVRAGNWRYWINTQTVLVVVVSGIFLIVLGMSTPLSNDSAPVLQGAGSGSSVLAAHAEQTLPAQETPPADGAAPDGAPPVETSAPTPTRTPFPQEFFDNADQTLGITISGVALVLIVLVGLWTLRPPKEE